MKATVQCFPIVLYIMLYKVHGSNFRVGGCNPQSDHSNKSYLVVPSGDMFITYRAFSLTWPASMLIYWNKRKHLHEKRVKLPEDFHGTPTWLPFHRWEHQYGRRDVM